MILFTLYHLNIDQSAPNLMSLIMEKIKPENLELFALEFGKIAETDQSAPNLVKMYVTVRSRMSYCQIWQ